MLRSLFQTDPERPGKVVTTTFHSNAIDRYAHQRYGAADVYKLIASRNRDGSYDVGAKSVVPGQDVTTTVRYGISLDDALEELKAFEDTGMAAMHVAVEADREKCLQREVVARRGSNNVYTILEKRAANEIENAACKTGTRTACDGKTMRLAKLRRNPRC